MSQVVSTCTAGPSGEDDEILDLVAAGVDKLPLLSNQQYSRLKRLFCNGNRIIELDCSLISRLGNLRYLDLRSNCLQSLPGNISSLTRLQVLLVQDNKITSLPLQLEKLHISWFSSHVNMAEKFRRMSLGLPALRREFSDNSTALIKPDDQLELTPQELNEDITKTLNAKNPEDSANVVQFNFKKGQYTLSQDKGGNLYKFHHKSVLTTIVTDEVSKTRQTTLDTDYGKNASAEDKSKENENEKIETGEVERGGKKFFNAFNYCEQSSQTPMVLIKHECLQTQPPPRHNFRRNVNKSSIYDAYIEDIAKKKAEKMSHQKSVSEIDVGDLTFLSKVKRETDDFSTKIRDQLTRMERAVVQNIYDEIYQDFKYFEDPCDAFKEKEGSLLPLWEFTTVDKSKRLEITDLCWNPHFPDVFAATYGSNEFQSCREPTEILSDEKGRLCIYTLQNPTFPKYSYETTQYIMCVDIHPDYPHLLCIGLYDGTVKVLSLQTKKLTPVSRSKVSKISHTTSVTKVRWASDSSDGTPSFLSISTDGCIFCWELSGPELRGTEMVSLTLPNPPVACSGDSSIHLRACCSSLSFFSKDLRRVLVGTEEGYLFDCRLGFTAQSSYFLAHYQTITAIDFNHFNTNVFVTCSEDGLLRIWSACRNDNKSQKQQQSCQLLLEFDLHSPVLGVAWSPFTSTVLAASSLDGRMHVFDLALDRSRPLCVQQLVDAKRYRLTRMAFNSASPIIVVGDSRGRVTAVKLSPNLRLKPKLGKKADESQYYQIEKDQLEKVLGYVQLEPEIKQA